MATDEEAITKDAVRAFADATEWILHGIRYADDDAMQCMCGWNADGDPDRVQMQREHVIGIGLAAAAPILLDAARIERALAVYDEVFPQNHDAGNCSGTACQMARELRK